MFDLAFQTAIVTWIKNTTGLTFAYAANQNGQNPCPTGYATYNIIGAVPHTHADFSVEPGAVPGDVEITYVAHTAVTVSVNVYHIDGARMIIDLFNVKRTLNGRKPFYDINASLLSFSGLRDLSGVRDAQYQPRYQADYVFNYRTKLVDPGPLDESNKVVDKLSINGTIENDDVEIIGWDNL